MEQAEIARTRQGSAASRARRVPRGLAAVLGAIVLLLAGPGFATTDGPGTGSSAEASERTAPHGVSITGALVAERGDPVNAPLVVCARYRRAPDGAGSTTLERRVAPDAAGRFHVVLPPGQADLRLDVRGFVPAEHGSVDLVPGSVLDLGDVRCRAGATLTGRVVDTSGQPVEGARVTALDRGRRFEAASDADGRFAIAGLVPGRTVDVGADREGYTRGPLVVGHPGVRETELRLASHASLALSLTIGVPPRPARHVVVELVRLEGGGDLQLAGLPLKRTLDAEDGRIALDGLDAGRWSVRFFASGAEPVALDDVTLEPGERHDAGELHAAEGARIAGHVRDANDGRPIAGARVGVESDGLLERTDPAFTATTDDLGRFVLDGLPARPLRLVALHGSYVETTVAIEPLPGVPAEVEVELGARGAVTGVALDPGGAPRAGWGVLVTGLRLAGGPASTVTDADGRFRIDGLEPGTYRALLLPPQDAPAIAVATHAVTVRAHETAVVDFGPAPGALHVRGAVTRGGRPAAASMLWTRPGALPGVSEVVAVSTAGDGAFDADLAAAGTWDVTITPAGDGDAVMRRVALDGAPVLAPFELEGAVVTGTVVDARDGRPLAGATVQLAVPGEPLAVAAPSVSTDALGRFRIPSASGAVDVVVRRAGYGAQRKTRVRTGDGFDVRCALAPEVPLSVRVVDAAGRPIAGAAVMVLGDAAGAAPPVFTATDGVARVHGAPSGVVDVGAVARTLAPAVRRVDTTFETTATLVLADPAGPLAIVALGERDAPRAASPVEVLARGVDLSPLLRVRALHVGDEPLTDGSGRLEPGPLAAGDYTVRIAGGPSAELQLGPGAKQVTLR